MNLLLAILGGGLGSGLRYLISGVVADRCGEAFPWGTLVANVSGSLAIGCFATLTGPDGRWLVPPGARVFFMIGICGGYTTFSSFSLQTLSLVRDGEWLKAGANAVLSFTMCMAAVWLGHVLAASLNSTKGI
ncbi:MAG: fluoride efflux transporter CrcB [Verrucomicrobia bacterium]|nr:fluoride efflux transporter CrcB [Verrucomicrobiota bacterium]